MWVKIEAWSMTVCNNNVRSMFGETEYGMKSCMLCSIHFEFGVDCNCNWNTCQESFVFWMNNLNEGTKSRTIMRDPAVTEPVQLTSVMTGDTAGSPSEGMRPARATETPSARDRTALPRIAAAWSLTGSRVGGGAWNNRRRKCIQNGWKKITIYTWRSYIKD